MGETRPTEGGPLDGPVDTAIRVLLVDDHDLVRAGFRALLDLEPGFEVVGEAADGAEAVRRARDLRPDVICMDVQMPVMDGIDATRTICADDAVDARVIVLTTFRDDHVVHAALRAGASGFVLKNSPPAVLAESIRTVHDGDALIDPQVTMSVIAAMRRGDEGQEWDGEAVADRPGPASPARTGAAATSPRNPAAPSAKPAPVAHQAPVSPQTPAPQAPVSPRAPFSPQSPAPRISAPQAPPVELARLTGREREVLGGVARGLSNTAIATELFVSEATVKTHVSNLLAKLGVRDRIHVVIFAYEHGVISPQR